MSNICEECYQGSVCEMKGRPFFLSQMTGDNKEATSRACFFHCCSLDVIAALRTLELNPNKEMANFSTLHKPFQESTVMKGRMVVIENTGLFDLKALLWVDEKNKDKKWYKSNQEHPMYKNQFIETNDIKMCFPILPLNNLVG